MRNGPEFSNRSDRGTGNAIARLTGCLRQRGYMPIVTLGNLYDRIVAQYGGAGIIATVRIGLKYRQGLLCRRADAAQHPKGRSQPAGWIIIPNQVHQFLDQWCRIGAP